MTPLWVSYIHFLLELFFYDKMDLRLFYFPLTNAEAAFFATEILCQSLAHVYTGPRQTSMVKLFFEKIAIFPSVFFL